MMGFFSNVVALSRFQFALTVAFHFLFVPMSIGLGLILAIMSTRYYKSRDSKDLANLKLFVKIFAATFVVGVATGITMEFAFGTNWANYSRFVGDIFGAPLAAEALFAFFLESTFLGVLIFGQKRVSPKFYMVSGWLVWAGSCLSALWILIANSWMQTPAGFKVITENGVQRAHITIFLEAAINHSTIPRYFHTVDALLIMGAFLAMAIAAYYLLKGKHLDFAKKTIKVGAVVALITTILMIPFAHLQAAEMANNQPSKLAAVEGQWETGPADMSLIGWIDEAGQKTIAIKIPRLTSLLASFNPNASYTGLNDIPEADRPPLQITFQAYHLMVAFFGLIVVIVIGAFVLVKKNLIEKKRWAQYILLWAPLVPLVAIQAGWMVAEIGRQPWIVWGLMRTEDAISPAVPAPQLLITIILFIIVYLAIAIMYLRVVFGFIKKGPNLEDGSDPDERVLSEGTDTPAGSDSTASRAEAKEAN